MVIDMKEKIFTKERIKNIGIGFLICFLFTFMLMIFGPAEIYFVNVAEFKFVYGEFVDFIRDCACWRGFGGFYFGFSSGSSQENSVVCPVWIIDSRLCAGYVYQ